MLRTAGRVLVLAGVAVWGVFVVAWLAGAHPVAARFLPFHLAGVIPGAVISGLARDRRSHDPPPQR